jgi:hypothetical protein
VRSSSCRRRFSSRAVCTLPRMASSRALALLGDGTVSPSLLRECQILPLTDLSSKSNLFGI